MPPTDSTDFFLYTLLQLAHLLYFSDVGHRFVVLKRHDLFVDRIQDPAWLREELVVILEGRCDPVLRADDHGRGIEVIEGQLCDVPRDFVEEAAASAGIGGEDDLAGLLHGLDDLGVIKRYQRAEVDDLGAHAVFLLELFDGIHGAIQGGADGDDGDVVAGLNDIRFTEGDLVLAFGNAALMEALALVVNALALEEDDRIGAVQG